MAFCSTCGKRVDQAWSFCRACGAAVGSDTEPAGARQDLGRVDPAPSRSEDPGDVVLIRESRPAGNNRGSHPTSSGTSALCTFLTLTGTALLGLNAYVVFTAGLVGVAVVGVGVAAAFLVIGPIAWNIGDAFRRFAYPSMYFANGAVDLAKKRLFWMIGPQSIAVGLAATAAFMVVQGIAAQYETTGLTSETAEESPTQSAALPDAFSSAENQPGSHDTSVRQDQSDIQAPSDPQALLLPQATNDVLSEDSDALRSLSDGSDATTTPDTVGAAGSAEMSVPPDAESNRSETSGPSTSAYAESRTPGATVGLPRDQRAAFIEAAVGQWSSTACRQRRLTIRSTPDGVHATFDTGSGVRTFFRSLVVGETRAPQPPKADGTFRQFSNVGGEPAAALRVYATIDPSLPQWSAACTVVVRDNLIEVRGLECATDACGLTGTYQRQNQDR